MRFEGRVFKSDRFWAIEVPILGVFTQGRTRKESYEMVVDAIESLSRGKSPGIIVYPGVDGYFEVGADDESALVALLLRRLRTMQGLTVEEVARRLGSKSHTSYARYEQGKSLPSVERFGQLFAALNTGRQFVLKASTTRD